MIAVCAGLAFLASVEAGAAQTTNTRARLDGLEVGDLRFAPPEVLSRELDGVPVFHLEDRSLPLTDFFVYARGGYGLFDRSLYAASMGLPALLRYGGTLDRAPAEVDELVESLALQMSFGSAGGSVTASLNTLTEHVDTALDVWIEMLTRPGFDSAEVAAWRGRQMESVRRRDDDPARLAFSEFNRLMYGDHPIGWELGAVDLSEDRVSDHALRQVHRRVVCRDNLILGVSGDLSWTEAEPRLERLISSVPACSEPLPEPPSATVRRDPGIFVIDRELEQAVVVLGQATEVRLADQPDYFAAMLGNSILGAGGFSSRLMGRVRTQEGFAYSVSSLWTTPRRYPGLLGAVTRTRPDRVVETLGAILETMDGLTAAPPTEDEVGTTVDQTVNGFIFNFDRSAEIVARNVYYLAQDLPDDWLERYVSGIQAVTSEDVWRVFRTHMRTSEMTVLIVGDASRIGLEALGAFGRVTELRPR